MTKKKTRKSGTKHSQSGSPTPTKASSDHVAASYSAPPIKNRPNYMSPTKSSSSRKGHHHHDRPRRRRHPLQVLLIRHGESMGQVARSLGMDRRRDARLLDCPLTHKGEGQAHHLGRHLIEQRQKQERVSKGNGTTTSTTTSSASVNGMMVVDMVISSPLTRAIQTALLAFPHHKTIHIHAHLAELGSKVPENTRRDIQQVKKDVRHLLVENHHLQQHYIRHLDTQTFHDGHHQQQQYESKSNQHSTLDRVMMDIVERIPEHVKRIAIVCHYCVIQRLLHHTGREIRPQNATPFYCTLNYNDDDDDDDGGGGGGVLVLDTSE